MSRFDKFTTKELTVINGALFRIIDEHERGDDFNTEEYKIAASMYPTINSIILQRQNRQVHKFTSGSEIKERILGAGLKLWQVAYAYGVTDSNFSRLLRKGFTDEQTEKIQSIIEQLKGDKRND